MKRWPAAQRGMSLIEVLTVMVVLSLVMSMLGSFYVAALKLFREGSLTSDVMAEAAWAVRWMEADLRAARRATTAQTSQVVLVLPRKDVDGRNVVPLEDGDEVWYYRGTADGAVSSSGSYLWQAVKAYGAGQFTITRRLASHLTSLTFSYSPDSADPTAVKVSLTVQATEGPKTVNRTESGWLTLRNHGL
jgi:prepilin-type N-terminal cleavage/methylation domain-containing protein